MRDVGSHPPLCHYLIPVCQPTAQAGSPTKAGLPAGGDDRRAVLQLWPATCCFHSFHPGRVCRPHVPGWLETGFFKPNVSTMVGNLYPEGSHLKIAPTTSSTWASMSGLSIPVIAEIAQQIWISSRVCGGRVRDGDLDRHFAIFQDAHRADRSTRLNPGSCCTGRSPSMGSGTAAHYALIAIYLIIIVFWMVFHQNRFHDNLLGQREHGWKVSGSFRTPPIQCGHSAYLSLVALWRWLDRRGREPSSPEDGVRHVLHRASFHFSSQRKSVKLASAVRTSTRTAFLNYGSWERSAC